MAAVDTPATAEEVQERTLQPGPGSPDRMLDQNSPDSADPDIGAVDTGLAAPAGDTAAGSAQDKWEPG
jgi:hypothetical protein